MDRSKYREFTHSADWPRDSIVIYVYDDGTASVTKGDRPYARERFPFDVAVDNAETMRINEPWLKEIIVHLSEGVASPQQVRFRACPLHTVDMQGSHPGAASVGLFTHECSYCLIARWDE